MRSGLPLTLPEIDVLVVYEVLEPTLDLPEQIDIVAVWLELSHGPEALRKKRSRVNILYALDEGTIINMEDEILERRTDTSRARIQYQLPQEPHGAVEAGNARGSSPIPFEYLKILAND